MSIDVRRGEVLGLLGPNGAGKTTTVRLLTALIEPTEGTAAVDGFDVRTQPDDVRARVGILTETPGLYDKLSATRNLDFFGRLYGLDAATRAERIEHYLRLFGLWERRDDVAGTFSKGMKQKLAIARALLHEPAVVFLDEPTAALDPEAAFVVREAIEDAARCRSDDRARDPQPRRGRPAVRPDRVRARRAAAGRFAGRGCAAATGRARLAVRLGAPPDAAMIAAAVRARRVRASMAPSTGSTVDADEPGAVAPAVVRALVGGRRGRGRGPRRGDVARADLLRRHGRPAGAGDALAERRRRA